MTTCAAGDLVPQEEAAAVARARVIMISSFDCDMLALLHVTLPVAVALSTCRVCRQSFVKSENSDEACAFHPGRWSGAENGKHFGTHTGPGGVKPGLTMFWDCCSATTYDALGCCRQRHLTYDDPEGAENSNTVEAAKRLRGGAFSTVAASRRLLLCRSALFAALAISPPLPAQALRLPDLMAGVAGPGGVQLFGPSGELGRLSEARAQLQTLSADLSSGTYTANEDDSIVVLKISAIYFKSTPGLMRVTTEVMDQLRADEVTEAARLTDAFDEAVKELEQACRDRDLTRQKEGAAKAGGVLSSYLELAAVHYAVPVVR